MNFVNISEKTNCDCLTDAAENTADTFVRRVRRSPNLSNADFKNDIERNKLVTNEYDCGEVCGMHGVSIEIWNDSSTDKLTEKYLRSAAYSPQFKKNLSVFRFKPNCGVIKHTPNQKIEYNEYHYDFYKDDAFMVESLELVSMIQLIGE